MSYNIVKKIEIVGDKVFVTSACNNVIPRTPRREESTYLSKILKEKGRQALDIDILKAYESGEFQGGQNKYTRALEVLRHMPTYQAFDWHNGDYKIKSENRLREAGYLYALMEKAFTTRLPYDKYVITKTVSDGIKCYLYHRANSGFCKWYEDIKRAKVFRFLEDAKNYKKSFTNSDSWEVIAI